MATTLILQGIVQDVLPLDRYDEEDPGKRRQHIILHIPQWTDPLEQKRGKIETWKITALNQYITKNRVSTDLIGKKIEAVCYISSKEVQREGNKIYPVSVRLKRLVEISELDINRP